MISEPHWFGDELPHEWPLQRISYLGRITLGKMVESNPESAPEGRPYMRAANVQPDGVLALDDVKTMPFTAAEASRLTLRRGDVVIVEGGVGGYGRSAYVGRDLDGWGFQNSIVRVRPSEHLDGRFLTYCMLHLRAIGYIAITASTASMPHFTAEKVSATQIPAPALDLQRQISDFLDRETGEIDAFIADQERLIELLTERRRAIVAHQFSRNDGWRILTLARLDPRQESGVSVNGSVGVSIQIAGEVGVLKTGAASKGWFDPSENKLVDDEHERQRVACPVRAGRVLVTRANTPLLVGTAAYVPDDHPNLFLSDKLWLLDFGPWTRYLSWWMHTEMYFDQVRISASGASPSMWNLAYEDFRRFSVALPDERDRDLIVERVEAVTLEIDAAIADARGAIALSKERRAALISAAVTGRLAIPATT